LVHDVTSARGLRFLDFLQHQVNSAPPDRPDTTEFGERLAEAFAAGDDDGNSSRQWLDRVEEVRRRNESGTPTDLQDPNSYQMIMGIADTIEEVLSDEQRAAIRSRPTFGTRGLADVSGGQAQGQRQVAAAAGDPGDRVRVRADGNVWDGPGEECLGLVGGEQVHGQVRSRVQTGEAASAGNQGETAWCGREQ
jgi:hypothetical protein